MDSDSVLKLIPDLTRSAWVFGAITGGMFAWQHFSNLVEKNRRRKLEADPDSKLTPDEIRSQIEIKWKPSFFLNTFGEHMKKASRWLGYQWANISSFLEICGFDELHNTASDLIKPIGVMVESVPCFFSGYMQCIKEFYNNSGKKDSTKFSIILGSTLIIFGLASGIWMINKYGR